MRPAGRNSVKTSASRKRKRQQATTYDDKLTSYDEVELSTLDAQEQSVYWNAAITTKSGRNSCVGKEKGPRKTRSKKFRFVVYFLNRRILL